MISSAAAVLGQSRDQGSAAAHGLGGISQSVVAAVAAVVVRLLGVQQSTAANLGGDWIERHLRMEESKSKP